MFSFILLQGRGDHWVSRAEIKSVESHERRQLLYIYNTVPAEHKYWDSGDLFHPTFGIQ